MKTAASLLLLLMTLQDPRTRAIEGVVVDAVTEQPLANATVSTVLSNTGPLTDASGHFRVEGVQLGRLQFRVRAKGYTTKEITIDTTSDERKPFTFRLQRPTGVVTGQVIDTRGQPAVYARVRLMAYFFLDFRSSHAGPDPTRSTLREFKLPLADSDTTDDRGIFRISGVPSGDYYLRIEPSRRDQPPEGFSSLFYPGFTSVSRAESIHVAAGVETRLDTMTLAPATLGRIKVRVVDSTGQLLTQPDSQVLGDGLLLREESTGFMDSGDPDGGFAIWSIRPSQIGNHLLCFVRLLVPDPNDLAPVPNPSGCVPVDYTGNAMEITLNVTKPNGHLHFRLALEDMGDASVRDFQLNVRGQMSNSTEPFSCNLKSDGDCRFVANPVLYAGNGILTSVSNPQSLPSDYYVASVRQGNRDVLIDGFEIPPGADSVLDIVVSGAGGRLRGKVLDSAGKPVISSEIALVPQDALAARSDFASTYRTTQTDQNGNYEFRGLAPGDYRAYAVTNLNNLAFWDPGVTQPFNTLATTIHVEKNSRLSADLNLVEASGK